MDQAQGNKGLNTFELASPHQRPSYWSEAENVRRPQPFGLLASFLGFRNTAHEVAPFFAAAEMSVLRRTPSHHRWGSRFKFQLTLAHTPCFSLGSVKYTASGVWRFSA